MPKISFTKMHGAGNDYIYVDCISGPIPERPEELARVISDRHKGVGGDGLILICQAAAADAKMRMFNADGSEAEMCGNGIRCLAKYLFDKGICRKEKLRIETGAGILTLELHVENGTVSAVRVNMGQPTLEAGKIPTKFQQTPVVDQPLKIGNRTFQVCCLSMGNPHCVVFAPELSDDLVLGWGPKIEINENFPQRVNVEFVQVINRGEVRQRTWERGSGETLACGTGASAVCVAGVLADRTDRRIVNHLLGGTLTLEWNDESRSVFMTGPAEMVFSGVWDREW